MLSRYSRDINKMFLCDRGRFGYEYVNAPQRIREARVAWRPVSQATGGDSPADAARDRRWTRRPSLLRGRRVIGIGSPRASLEDNFALRTLVGADRFYLGLSETDYDLARRRARRRPRRGVCRPGSLADVQDADAVFVLGEDLTNTAPMLDLTVRTWLRLRPTAQEERVHIRRWNDAAIGRAKRREPSALWIATPYAAKLDELAAETWRAAPDDIARLALALAHELDPAAPEVADLSDDERERVARWSRGPARQPPAGDPQPASAAARARCSRAAAQLARVLDARRDEAAGPARLILTVPEPNSVGLRMMGGGRLPQAIAAVARGEADSVVVLDNDLYRRTASLLVDDLFAREARRAGARAARRPRHRARRRRAALRHHRRVHRHLREPRGPCAALLRGARARRATRTRRGAGSATSWSGSAARRRAAGATWTT